MIIWILEKFLGVELKRKNLNLKFRRILTCILVIVSTYAILGPLDLFNIIENLINLSAQSVYAEILAKYSFIAVSIRIIFLSLFTDLNNPLGRFRAAFSVQMISFVVGVIMHYMLNGFINPSPNIDSVTKFIYGLLPFVVNIFMFFVVKQIYEDKKFDERKFFRTD